VVNALSARRGGGRTYLLNLFGTLGEFSNLRVVVITHAEFAQDLAAYGVEIVVPRIATGNVLFRAVWESTVLPRMLKSLNANVLYCPGGLLSGPAATSCSTAVAFRNMLPFDERERRRYPRGYMRFRLWLLRRLMASAFKRADLLIFLSDHARQTIDATVPARRGRCVVIPHGVSPVFFPGGEVPRPASLPQSFVLYVSLLDAYKAQLEVIEAWHLLRKRRFTQEKLVLIGESDLPYGALVRNSIQALGLGTEVLVIGKVPYIDLPAWYQNAKVSLFASSCENCPNILLEAMAAGRPVLSSNYPPMPEIAGSGARYFDPYNPNELADALAAVLDDEQLRMAMGQSALERARKFDAIESARRTWQALIGIARSVPTS